MSAKPHRRHFPVSGQTLWFYLPILAVVIVGAAAGSSKADIGTLTVDNLTLNGGGELTYDLSSSPNGLNDLIVVRHTLTMAGVTTIAANWYEGVSNSSGTYTLIRYDTKNYTGPITDRLHADPESLPGDSRKHFTFDDSVAHKINLIVTGSPLDLRWDGNASADWTTANTANNNWKRVSNGDGDTFWTYDTVTFDDTAATGTVNIPGRVRPASVTVNNETKAYVFSGGGDISGDASLTKTGIGDLTICNSNTYTGPTVVEEGRLLINGTGNVASTIQVKGGARIGGDSSAALPAIHVESRGVVAPGNASYTGTLTTSDLTLADKAILFHRLADTGVSTTVVTGAVHPTGTTTVNVDASGYVYDPLNPPSAITLLSYGTALSGPWNALPLTDSVAAREISTGNPVLLGLSRMALEIR